jgi:glycosyltransferase involved in cell wall biosynthesis
MCNMFRDLGHEVAVSANFGLHGAVLDWNGIPTYPRYRAGLGQDVIGVHAKDFGADVVLSLYDIWVLDKHMHNDIPVPWVGMVPVDGAPISQKMHQIASTIDYRIAYSRFGKEQMERAGLDCFYVPHCIDTDKFVPGDKWAVRDALGIPRERFIVTVIAANKGFPCRKGWPELLEAYARFHRRHNEALLYLHTTNVPYGSQGEGIDIRYYLSFLGVQEAGWKMVNEAQLALGVPEDYLVQMYQASDVFLLPSMGEGCGLPLLEAQACGCPVITQNASATAESCVNGIAIEPLQHMWLPALGYYWELPSIERIDKALEMVWREEPSAAWWQEQKQRGIEHVRRHHSIDRVKNEWWKPCLESIERQLW